jgi:hypothetical protein
VSRKRRRYLPLSLSLSLIETWRNRAGNESNFRTSAYEAITSYVTHATPDTIPVVQNTVVAILHRMEHLLSVHVSPLRWVQTSAKMLNTIVVMQNQILGIDDRNNWNELQSNFCSVVIVCGHAIKRSLTFIFRPSECDS